VYVELTAKYLTTVKIKVKQKLLTTSLVTWTVAHAVHMEQIQFTAVTY